MPVSKPLLSRALLFAALLTATSSAFAAKGYQVTGPVSELTDSKIVVMKGKEKFEIARNPETKVTGGELKVGDKVTVYYDMTATDVDVKADKKMKK
jgi:hypothetical protein